MPRHPESLSPSPEVYRAFSERTLQALLEAAPPERQKEARERARRLLQEEAAKRPLSHSVLWHMAHLYGIDTKELAQ